MKTINILIGIKEDINKQKHISHSWTRNAAKPLVSATAVRDEGTALVWEAPQGDAGVVPPLRLQGHRHHRSARGS